MSRRTAGPLTTQSSKAEVVGYLIGAVTAQAFIAWLVMLTIGALHSAYPEVEPIGYGASVLAVLAMNLVAALIRKALGK
ncbi:hypothetical protein [Streptomyces tsukubensis]|uniref:hypothetical protein n=1 Tax=Streptomyces tsukubensis TaxID=83656 RepID=UPI00344CDB4A